MLLHCITFAIGSLQEYTSISLFLAFVLLLYISHMLYTINPSYFGIFYLSSRLSFKEIKTIWKKSLYLTLYLPFLVLFISMCISILYHFPSAWRTSFNISCAQVCWWWTVPAFVCICTYCLYFERYFCWVKILDWDFFSLFPPVL